MTPRSTLVEDMERIVIQEGGKALEIAEDEMLSKFSSDDDISLALRYFAEVTLRNALPVFPALVSISCESVDSKTDKASSIGGAITLIAGAADLHDDVIDQSPIKNGKRTVFGKFGKDVTLLAGDALLAWGLARLQKECESIPSKQGYQILDFLTNAILEMSRAEAQEARLKAKKRLSMKTYLDLIELKAIVPEVNMKIGAVLGNAKINILETLGHFGKTFGIVSTVAEEFMDVIEHTELQNRLKNDYPPLPFQCALQDPALRSRVLSIKNRALTKKNSEELTELILNCPKANKLKKDMRTLVRNEIDLISSVITKPEPRNKLEILLTSSQELLEGIDS